MPKICCFGEVLWDDFSTHRTIGGAPLNVGLRLHSTGHDVTILSSIGKDKLGEELLDYLKINNLVAEGIQIDENLRTGIVSVVLDKSGSASYTIEHPVAWDNIQITDFSKKIVKEADAFVYGSLAARDTNTMNTLNTLLEIAKFKIFDLNLRPPHYSEALLFNLMNQADFIKFNDDELFEVCEYLGAKHNSLEQNIHLISKKTKSNKICVTKGRHGAVLLYNEKLYYNSGFKIKVVDTVGAGDSFLASLVSQLLEHKDPQEAIDFACAVGAMVAQKKGANPELTSSDIEQYINPDVE